MSEERIGKYLVVRLLPAVPRRKTSQWTVHSNDGATLGKVEWYGAWRQYVFAPAGETVFNRTCLDDICRFLGEQNFLRGHRADLKTEKVFVAKLGDTVQCPCSTPPVVFIVDSPHGIVCPVCMRLFVPRDALQHEQPGLGEVR